MERYLEISRGEAKNIVGKNMFMNFLATFFDFNSETNSELKKLNGEEVNNYIETAETIMYNDDLYIPHMQIWFTKQNPKFVERTGKMLDVLLTPEMSRFSNTL